MLKLILWVMMIFIAVYLILLVLNPVRPIYKGTSLNPNVIPTFSYEDAVEIAESI